MLWLRLQNTNVATARLKNNEKLDGFAKKSIQERLEFVKSQALTSIEAQESLEQNENLSLAVADQLSENVVGTFSLPYSIVPEVLVNGQEYTVPYVTEEPSVVAAASLPAKLSKEQVGLELRFINAK